MDSKISDWRPGPTVCRCCLSEGCYKDISTEYFWMGKTEIYADMLSETFNLSISYSQSGGPNSNSRLICEPCISRLRDASEFKRQVQECEKTFINHLDAGAVGEPSTASMEIETPMLDVVKGVKLEEVKLEKQYSDDEFDCRDFGDEDDDDDLDDQPLTTFATKVPKKESVDLLDLLDNTQITVKRKSKTKDPEQSKKPKLVRKATATVKAKASVSAKKVEVNKPVEKKKKETENESYSIAKRNAEIVLKYSTVYPFRLPDKHMTCVYCGDSIQDPAEYRKHMNEEHQTVNLRMAFAHCQEGFIKADCTHILCRICASSYDTLEGIARHLHSDHGKKLDFNAEIGLQPFKLVKNRLQCAICGAKSLELRDLSRHTQSHFLRFTCESCGKSYSTKTALKAHINFSHINNQRICRRCKSTFSSLEARRKHMSESPICWRHLCNVCGDRFMTWSLKQTHLVAVHGTQKKEYSCSECGMVFDCRKKYRIHFKITHTDDNYQCPCCELKFDTRRNLEEHRVIHTREKLFHCVDCSKSFSRKKNLTQHMWIHNEYKRFECKPCNKKFNQRVSWRTHMKSYHPNLADNDETKNNNVKFVLSLLKP